MFIPKKNKELRLYVNYRRINTLTIKDRYLLLLIVNIRDRFRKARYFIYLNLRNIFNLI